MSRGIQDRNALERFALEFCEIVERHCHYIIVSGFVAIASGRTRATEDIDMIIPKIGKEVFIGLHQDLAKAGFEAMQGDPPAGLYDHYLRDGLSIRYIRVGSPLPEMEVKICKDSLDEYQLNTRMKIPLTGLDLWFSSIDMNIAFKEELLKSAKPIRVKQPVIDKQPAIGKRPIVEKQRLEQIERWADYVRTDPGWKKHHTEFIDAQFDMARKFWARVLSQPGGKKRLREIYGIENEKALP